MIIALNGYAGSGKDTVATIIQYFKCCNPGELSLKDILENPLPHQWWLEDQSKWEIKKFAGKLKQIATILTGIPEEKFEDQEFKHRILGHEWWDTCDEGHTPMTVREFLQKLGTDGLRTGLHTDTWVNALMADYKPRETWYVRKDLGVMEKYTESELPNWVITDCRFPNEAKAVKDKGGLVIRIDRLGNKPVNDHPSETALDDYAFDYKICNGSDLEALAFTVQGILIKEKLL